MAIIPRVVTEASASGAQVIDGSLRFDGSKSQSLERTLTSDGNQTTWTWSAWVKTDPDQVNSSGGFAPMFFGGLYNTSGQQTHIAFGGSGGTPGQFYFTHYSGGYTTNLRSSSRYRDIGWYHIVVVFDSNNSTSGDRARVYVNGERVTSWTSETYPSSGGTTWINNSSKFHGIGKDDKSATENCFSGHMSQVYFIDGQPLDPSYFGYTDPLTGTWRPKKSDIANVGFNDGRVWSSSLVLSSGGWNGAASNGFNASLTGNASGDTTGATITLNISTTITVGSLGVYAAVTAGDPIRILYKLDGVTKETLNTGSSGAQWYYNASYAGEIDQIVISRDNRAPEFRAIIVNGQMLVDSVDGWGINGFYLPFDGNSPAGEDKSGNGNVNDGTTWSDDVTVEGGTFYSGSGAVNLFDGNLASNSVAEGDGQGEWVKWTPSSAVSFSDKIEVWLSNVSGGTTVSLKRSGQGSTDDQTFSSGSQTWHTLYTGSGQIEYIQVDPSNSNYTSWGGIRVDGILMLDDTFGNSWTPINFGGSVVIDNPIVSGALPILNTGEGGRVAVPGVRGQAGVAVTVYNSGSGNKYYLDGAEAGTVNFVPGQTVTFNTSNSTVSGHPFRFATAADAAGSTQYTSGSVTGASEGSAGAATTITIPNTAPSNLYYYCTNHSGMGGAINIGASNPVVADPYAWKCNLALPYVDNTFGTPTDYTTGVGVTNSSLMSSFTRNSATFSSSDGFYGNSLYMNGASDYPRINFSAGAMNFMHNSTGTGTIEFWAKPSSVVTGATWASTSGGSNQIGFAIGSANDGTETYISISNGSSGQSTNTTTSDCPTPHGKWVHIAAVKTPTQLRMYIDGILRTTKDITSYSFNDNNSSNNFLQHGSTINESGSRGWSDAYISNLRIYEGFAKYTGTTVGTQYFIPASTNPDIFPETPSGVVYSSELAKPITGSVSFRGPDSDNMTLGGSSDLAFGTGDFCVEFWTYITDIDNWNHFVDYRPFGEEIVGIMIRCTDGSLRASLNTNNSDSIQVDDACSAKRWYHIALTRSGTSVRLFKDGKVIGTTTSSDDLQNETDRPMIGGSGYHHKQHGMSGFISNLRMVKGSAVYTKDFIPPTSPLTNITNTKLLCCQSSTWASAVTVSPTNTENYGAGLYLKATTYADRGGSSCTVTNNGTVTSSSAGTNPFGIVDAASITGTQRIDLNMGNVSGTFFQNPWTLEMFFKKSGTGSDNWFVGTSTDGSSWNTGWSIDYTSNGLTWNYNNSSSLPMYIFLEANTWYFMRLQRDPGSGTYLSCEVYDSPENMVGSWSGTSTDAATHTNNVLKIGDANGNANNLGQTWMFSNVMLTAGDYGRQNVPPLVSGERVDGTSLSQQPIMSGWVGASGFNPFNTNINTVLGQETGYVTLNPLRRFSDNCTLTNGNLTATGSNESYPGTAADISLTSGKWYYEFQIDSKASNPMCGVVQNNYTSGGTGRILYRADGAYILADSSEPTNPSTFDVGDVIGVAIDLDHSAGYIRFYKDGVLEPVISGLNDLKSDLSISTIGGLLPYLQMYTNDVCTVNFGQKPFKFPPPKGFNPLCNANLQSPVLTRPDQYFSPLLYTSNNSTLSVSGYQFQPDLLIFKNRQTGNHWGWFDSVRGANEWLRSSSTSAQVTTAGGGYGTGTMNSFDRNGFTLGNDVGANVTNYPSNNGHVVYGFKAGGNKNTFNVDDVGYATAAAAGLDGGTITPTGASVGTKQGFSIVRYTGNSTANATLPHGLLESPKFVIIKNLSNTYGWAVLHTDVGTTGTTVDGSPEYYMLVLNSTAARDNWSQDTIWNPTSTTVKIDQSGGANWVNNSSSSYIMYAWHDVPGVQKFGTYEGNQNHDGPYVDLGFSPAIIIFKNIDSSANWMIYDNMRDPYNESYRCLYPNLTNGENTTSTDNEIDLLSTGFKLRNDQVQSNSSQTYIYAAWAHQPEHNLYGGQSNAR